VIFAVNGFLSIPNDDMGDKQNIRIDKFLWSVRIYKTRSIASDECRKGRIFINEAQVKPSRTVLKDEIIVVKKPPVIFSYKVIEPIENRVSAKLVGQFVEDLTPAEEKAKLDIRQSVGIVFRDKGTGRPTKKERRLIDRIQDDIPDLD
jgi:ribosome-associated heat shock protein Hsp15